VNNLDENVPSNQRQQLEYWRIRVRQISVNVGRRGMQDEEIIPFLHQLRRPTFFTRDEDFYDRRLCNDRYCLVYLAVGKGEVAYFVRRVIQHSQLDTQGKRMGAVLRVSSAGIYIWRLHSATEECAEWK
jgi:hypothetical protein